MTRFFLPGIVVAAATSGAIGHEVRPAYLEVRQTAEDAYDVLWKVPGRGEGLRLGVYAELPANCAPTTERYGSFVRGAFVERWSVLCAGGLADGEIHIAGLGATMTDVLARVERLDGTSQVARLTPEHSSFRVEAAPNPREVARAYLSLGVEHILLGVDHLLFVLALMMLVGGWRRLVGAITAFTAGHSLTLAAATLGFVRVPGPPVEAVIALSIVFVACETVHRHQGRSGLTERWPWVVAIPFGLLHGLGFAGALHEVGLPTNAIPTALLFFNLGVEVGQVLFIGVVAAMVAGVARTAARLGQPGAPLRPAVVETLAAYAIGTVAMFWVIQRTLGLVA